MDEHDSYTSISIFVQDLAREICVKGMIICGPCDSSPNAISLNISYYNGMIVVNA